MARQVSEIQTEIQGAIDADPVLSVKLTSPSKTAIFRLFRDIMALAIYNLEVLFDIHKAEVESLAARSEYGTIAWYGQKALEFQYGDTLTIIDGIPGYAVIDETVQIVKRASVSDGPTGGLIVKVAKEAAGELTALSAAEKSAFTYYFNKIKFAGVYTSIISLSADLLKGNITIYHDGQRDLVELEAELNSTVDAYVAGIDFDGRLVITKLIDALQAISGVTDVVVTSLMSKEPGDIYKAIVRSVNPASGYFKVDTGAGGIVWTLIAE